MASPTFVPRQSYRNLITAHTLVRHWAQHVVLMSYQVPFGSAGTCKSLGICKMEAFSLFLDHDARLQKCIHYALMVGYFSIY